MVLVAEQLGAGAAARGTAAAVHSNTVNRFPRRPLTWPAGLSFRSSGCSWARQPEMSSRSRQTAPRRASC
jgi:hypothetical protein